MNDITMDADMFSSMEGELISNIKRPSLLSLSSEDSLDDKIGNEATIASSYFKTSTPFKHDIVDDTICEKSDDGLEDYTFKMTDTHFPSSRSGKRYSLSSFNDASRLYSSIMNKSSSMQDVSSLASSFCPLRRDSCMFSTETLQSNSIATTKSKDSGFQRSTSCTSLTTNASKKYDHVQSKVKQYIQNIKQTEALRKMQKQLEKQASVYAEISGVTTAHTTSADSAAEVSQSPSPDSSPISKRDLLEKVKALEDELKERDCVIEQLEKNQSELRLKYAAAENQIDDLRIRASVHEDPLKNYISDEKVAELLTNNVKLTTRKYMDNAITKQLMRNMKRTDVPAFVRPGDSCVGSVVRDLHPITKFGSSSVRMGDDYKVLKSKTDTGILKSASGNCVKEGCYDLTKSASNVDRTSVRFADSDMMELPYEKNSFAKVQNWQRSLVNLSGRRDEDEAEKDAVRAGRSSRGHGVAGCCVAALTDDSAEENRRKTRRYLKNKDADKRRYQQRRSYPVGCRCEKFKCRSKEDVSSSGPPAVAAPHPTSKLVRSVSFASCEESLTSSLYDDGGGGSSSDESAVFVGGKHESYKEYKQRKLQQRFGKSGRRDRSPKWMAADLKKARSASSLAATASRTAADCATVAPSASQRNKRLLESVANSSYEYSCSSDRKQQQYSSPNAHQHHDPHHHHHHHYHHHHTRHHQQQHHNTDRTKYRKLDDCSKVASSGGCNALVKCRSSHACRSQGTGGYEDPSGIQHSKSFDACSRGHDKESGHRLNKVECSCLTALENLKIKEHNAFVKFAEHMRKHPPKVKEKEMPVVYKRYSLQK